MATRTNELAIIVRVRDFATREVDKIRGAFAGFGGRLEHFSHQMMKISMIMMSLAMVAAPFLAIAYAFGRMAKAGIEFNQTIEMAKLGIASIVMTNASIIDQQGRELAGREKLIAAQAQSLEIVRYLQRAGLETAATTQQLVEAYQQAVGPGLAVRMNLQQIAELTVRIVQGTGAIGVPMVQLNEEVRSILSGTINMHSRLAKTLGLTNEMVASWKAQGILYDKLMEKLGNFAEAGEEVARTWQGVTSNMQEAYQVFSGEIASGMFDTLRKKLVEVFSGIYDTKNLKVAAPFEGVVAGLKGIADEVGIGLALIIGDVVQGVKDLSGWIMRNKELLQSMWEVVKGIGGVIGGFVADVMRLALGFAKWLVESQLVYAVLKAAYLMIAGILDFISLIELGLRTVELAIDEALVRPLATALESGARLAEFFNKKDLAASFRSAAEAMNAGADANRLAMVNLAENFAAGKSHVQQAIALHQKLDASLNATKKTVKEVVDEQKKTLDTKVAPKPLDLTDDQKKKVEDFLTWFKQQSATIAGERAAMHGDEAAQYKAAYVKAIEEIAAKERVLKQEGIMEQKGMSPETLSKVRQAYAALRKLREDNELLFKDKTVQLELVTREKIAEMTRASDEKIHQAKLARIREQYSQNQDLLGAAIEEENLRYADLLRERANEHRRIVEDMASLWLEGSQRTIADLKSAYQDDLAAFRENVHQKKATWEEYDAYARAREYRLQEDLKQIQGTSTDGMKDAVRDYIDASGNEYNRGKEFFDKSVGGMETAIGDFLFAASQGTFKVREMFQSMGLSVLKAASEIIAKMIALRIVAGLGSIFTPGSSAASAVGGFGPAGGGAPVTAVAALGGIFQGGFQPAFAIPGGGSMPFRAFSSGGIVKRPTVGLVGEGGQNEAVVPLPDGKAIPVKMQGGDGGAPTITNNWNIVAMDTQNMDAWLASKQSTIEGMMADSLARAGLVRDAVRRYR